MTSRFLKIVLICMYITVTPLTRNSQLLDRIFLTRTLKYFSVLISEGIYLTLFVFRIQVYIAHTAKNFLFWG